MKYLCRPVNFCLLLFLIFPSLSYAETIRLKDGTKLEGTIGAWNADGTVFYFDPKGESESALDAPRWISMSDVEAIRYEGVVVKETLDEKESSPA